MAAIRRRSNRDRRPADGRVIARRGAGGRFVAAGASVAVVSARMQRQWAVITSVNFVSSHVSYDQPHYAVYERLPAALTIFTQDVMPSSDGRRGFVFVHVPRSGFPTTAAWGAEIEAVCAAHGVQAAAFYQCRWRFKPKKFVNKLFDEYPAAYPAHWDLRFSPRACVRAWLKSGSLMFLSTVFAIGPSPLVIGRSDARTSNVNVAAAHVTAAWIKRAMDGLGVGAVLAACDYRTIVDHMGNDGTGRILMQGSRAVLAALTKSFAKKGETA